MVHYFLLETVPLVVTHLLQLQLKLELLKLEKKSADVAHKFHLGESCFDVWSRDQSVLTTCVLQLGGSRRWRCSALIYRTS